MTNDKYKYKYTIFLYDKTCRSTINIHLFHEFKMNPIKGQKIWAKIKYSPYWPAEVRLKLLFSNINVANSTDKIILYLRLSTFLQKSQKHHEIVFASGSMELKISKTKQSRFFSFPYKDQMLNVLYFSGFIETKNVKDYVQNRSAYIDLGKGSDFKKAVADIDAQLNGTPVMMRFLNQSIALS